MPLTFFLNSLFLRLFDFFQQSLLSFFLKLLFEEFVLLFFDFYLFSWHVSHFNPKFLKIYYLF